MRGGRIVERGGRWEDIAGEGESGWRSWEEMQQCHYKSTNFSHDKQIGFDIIVIIILYMKISSSAQRKAKRSMMTPLVVIEDV